MGTGRLASWFLDKIASLTAAERRAEQVTLEHVLAEMRVLRTELSRLRAADLESNA